jgi:hypothetical protein
MRHTVQIPREIQPIERHDIPIGMLEKMSDQMMSDKAATARYQYSFWHKRQDYYNEPNRKKPDYFGIGSPNFWARLPSRPFGFA